LTHIFSGTSFLSPRKLLIFGRMKFLIQFKLMLLP
jgi:hypothetical protein